MDSRERIARGARILLAALVAVVVVPFVHQSFVGVPVTVNGVAVSALRGSEVGDVVQACGGSTRCRLVSVSTRTEISRSAAEPTLVLVNGMITPVTRTVHCGDDIRTLDGGSVIEPVVEETRTIDPAPRTIGRGSVPKEVRAGAPEVVVLSVGAYSGEVVATETVSPGTPAIWRMVPEAGTNMVALTFDDGPWPGQTEQILSILQERSVPATFFMLGMRIERAPDLARAVADAGHAIGNHTFWHVNLATAQPDVAAWEIEGTNQVIDSVTGARPTWIRAPGGNLGGPARAYIAQAGMRHALWTVDPQDWNDTATPEQLAWNVISTARPNAVIVMHDGGGNQAATIAALPMIIDTLRAYGYEFVTLDELPEVRSDW